MSKKSASKIKKTVSFSDTLPNETSTSNDGKGNTKISNTAVNSSESNDWKEKEDDDSNGKKISSIEPAPVFKSTFAIVPYHYLLVLFSMFYHHNITQDVILGLKQSLILLIGLQIVYGYILLFELVPPSASKVKKSAKQMKQQNSDINFLYIFASLVLSCLLAFPVYVIIVLFGAPFLSLTLQTLLLSLHFSLITIFPLFIVYNFTKANDFNHYCYLIFSNFSTDTLLNHQVYFISIGGVIGTWLGVFPIPLDWDRDWQKWPITLIVGGYTGSVIGALFSSALNFYLSKKSN
ncbi:hypothetical protein PACTADRAFT_185606 [Pachysolen tannophilus NRRL Y-2460]|uniref:Glycosylphosphatidylinositol anchor biosynthesis protein 11 n=1 Tax=Pachysolen tannophilus NRRL Y-2460 TaxID=669874 RepID=A0A1E4U1Z1_PACTA|nr:hypothetical protein PACTADRAFT_185606 [Pachysolen tannophilus NRRL Y-2460]